MAALPSLSLSIINLDAQDWKGMVAYFHDPERNSLAVYSRRNEV